MYTGQSHNPTWTVDDARAWLKRHLLVWWQAKGLYYTEELPLKQHHRTFCGACAERQSSTAAAANACHTKNEARAPHRQRVGRLSCDLDAPSLDELCVCVCVFVCEEVVLLDGVFGRQDLMLPFTHIRTHWDTTTQPLFTSSRVNKHIHTRRTTSTPLAAAAAAVDFAEHHHADITPHTTCMHTHTTTPIIKAPVDDEQFHSRYLIHVIRRENRLPHRTDDNNTVNMPHS